MEELQSKILEILKRQQQTELAIKELQTLFYEELVSKWVLITNIAKPLEYEKFYTNFTEKYHKPIVQNIVNDLDFIFASNIEYFYKLGLTAENARKLVKDISLQLGLKDGVIEEGYFNDILKDTTIKKDVRSYIIKQSRNKALTNEVRAELKQVIQGFNGQLGLFEKFYTQTDRVGSTIFDVYQRADRIAQQSFAESIGLQAAIYEGGLIGGSRDFCKERNGKIFLKSEIKKWSALDFQGKPKSYDPMVDLGGYRCRHFWGWVGNETAMRLDPTLRSNKNRKLYRV